jgi:sec-independent protein translocase protein TatB
VGGGLDGSSFVEHKVLRYARDDGAFLRICDLVVNLFPTLARRWPVTPVTHYDESMIPGFSGEMIFIFFLALILFGPKKMPEIGRQVARLLGEFRRASNEFRSQIESEINTLDQNDRRQQVAAQRQAPLGALASRILNPPSAQESKTQESKAEVSSAAENPATEIVSADHAVIEMKSTSAEPVPVAKAAPDA